ncbi:ORF6N domain-containing protein [Petrimonas sp.]|uniref:ORF6N domain-containing protein n=1 Tax=Petrimonas sp. TaxID=2023866 RepID=UPI003F517DCE
MELQIIQQKILTVRGNRVMVDFHLAELYGVETKALKRAVRRNIDRFPVDFMFEMSKDEFDNLRSQLGTSTWGGTRYLPYCFTQEGIAMLSSVLHSKTAIDMNIAIMRAFVVMRRMVHGYEELLHRIEELEVSTDEQFNELYKALTALLADVEERRKPRKPVGFIHHVKNERENQK